MAVNPDFKDLLLALSDARARFLIVGAHAVMHYTTPLYRSATTSYGGVPIGLLSIDDLIRNKESVGRLQDQLDVESLGKAIRRTPT